MTTFMLIVFGMILGWLTPRPYIFEDIEYNLWKNIKSKIPVKYRWW